MSVALRSIALLLQRRELTVSELAEEVGVSSSTAHRVLRELVAGGFATQPAPNRAYRIGTPVKRWMLAAQAPVSVSDAAAPEMNALQGELGETVSLVVMKGTDVRFVMVNEGWSSVRVGSRLGHTVPAHTNSGGKAILAAEGAERIRERYRGRSLKRVTSRTVTRWSDLLAQLEQARQVGWAANFGESDEAVGGIGAAILLSTGEPIAAISVAIPTSRLRSYSEAEALAPAVLEARERIHARLRHHA